MHYPERATAAQGRSRPGGGDATAAPSRATARVPRAAGTPRAGFTLLEIMIAVAIFMIAIGGIITALATSSALVDANRETVLAYHGAQSVLEDMKGGVFLEAFLRFNADPADDPPGVTSPGKDFAVRGLDPRPGDPDGFVGEVLFPVVGASLREDVLDADFGTPRDLSGDGVIDGVDHSTDYRMLPVKVRLEWTGKGGERELEFVAMLTDL